MTFVAINWPWARCGHDRRAGLVAARISEASGKRAALLGQHIAADTPPIN
jgi:hypothetical protein